MRIIIIGDGKVGYKLAKQLSAEKYDIVMIDSNENKLRFAMDLSLIHISEPTRRTPISYAVFCLKKKRFPGSL